MIKWLCGWPHPVICEHRVGVGAGRPEGVGQGHPRAGKTGEVLASRLHHGGRWGWAGAESGRTLAIGRQGGPCEEAAPNAQKGLLLLLLLSRFSRV